MKNLLAGNITGKSNKVVRLLQNAFSKKQIVFVKSSGERMEEHSISRLEILLLQKEQILFSLAEFVSQQIVIVIPIKQLLMPIKQIIGYPKQLVPPVKQIVPNVKQIYIRRSQFNTSQKEIIITSKQIVTAVKQFVIRLFSIPIVVFSLKTKHLFTFFNTQTQYPVFKVFRLLKKMQNKQ